MRLKSANIAGFHEYSSSNNNTAMNALKFKLNITSPYSIYKTTENSSLQKAKIQKHEGKRRKNQNN